MLQRTNFRAAREGTQDLGTPEVSGNRGLVHVLSYSMQVEEASSADTRPRPL